MSRISIIIPCRNGATFLGQTLRSALNQTRVPDEILVIDDVSTDNSRAVAEGFGPPVRVLSGSGTGGAAARTLGAKAACGDLIMFLDADDLLTPPTLEALAQALEGQDGAAAVCPWDRYELHNDVWIARPPSIPPPRPGQDLLAAWLTGRFAPPCCVMWTRAGFEASGGWRSDIGLDEDGTLMRRALARGIPVLPIRKGLALYRRMPGTMQSHSMKRKTAWGLQSRLAALTDTIDELEQAGRLTSYRVPLSEALALLAEDDTDLVLNAEIAELSRRIGGPPPLLRLRRHGGMITARAAARYAEWRQPRPGQTAGHAPVTIPAIAASAAGSLPTGGTLVSVIVPTFNRAALVTRAVRSVLNQTWRDLELLVIDDGSTDGTADCLATNGDPRLRVIRQDNGGVARARNRGLDEARGDWIAFLDSDDLWRPEKLSRQMAVMAHAPARVGFCHTSLTIATPDGSVDRPAHAQGRIFEASLLDNVVCGPGSSGLVRRQVIGAVGGFDPTLPAIEDWDWMQRIARLYDVAAVPEPLVVYHDSGENRRSKAFRANLIARDMLWTRNRHALRRAGLAHLFLIESARRELREPEGCPRKGRALVLAALAERPAHGRHLLWLPYMMAPFRLRSGLRTLEGMVQSSG